MSLEKPPRDLEALFHPNALRTALISVALFVLAYENFQDRVVEHVRMLYWSGIDQEGHKYDEEAYKREIGMRNRSSFYASLDWFRERGAIDDEDMAVIDRLKRARNRLVHELPRIVATEELTDIIQEFPELARVFRKVEVWHLMNVELATDPDWMGKEINEDEVMPGPMLMMQILTDVALGDEARAWEYYKGLQKHGEDDSPDASAT